MSLSHLIILDKADVSIPLSFVLSPGLINQEAEVVASAIVHHSYQVAALVKTCHVVQVFPGENHSLTYSVQFFIVFITFTIYKK